MQRAGNRGGNIEGPKRVVRELGTEEEGLRGGRGEERDCGGGEQGSAVSPYQGADGPKVVGQGRARDNICKKGGAIWERESSSGIGGQRATVSL